VLSRILKISLPCVTHHASYKLHHTNLMGLHRCTSYAAHSISYAARTYFQTRAQFIQELCSTCAYCMRWWHLWTSYLEVIKLEAKIALDWACFCFPSSIEFNSSIPVWKPMDEDICSNCDDFWPQENVRIVFVRINKMLRKRCIYPNLCVGNNKFVT